MKCAFKNSCLVLKEENVLPNIGDTKNEREKNNKVANWHLFTFFHIDNSQLKVDISTILSSK